MRVSVEFEGICANFETREGLFSPAAPDRGSMAMLRLAQFRPGMRVLDLGCGWGLVGVLAAKACGAENVAMCDVDPVAVDAARQNCAENGVENVRIYLSDGLAAVDETGFDLILSNPPYQSDFAVAKRFLEKGFNRLAMHGRFLMVTKRREWYKKKMIAVFGGVRIHEVDGYFIFEAQKRQMRYAMVRS
ncbi:MAG: methyltransferase [Eubacteriales bacterium]|nr:methyltransferase [Eubacteriales bacterium]